MGRRGPSPGWSVAVAASLVLQCYPSPILAGDEPPTAEQLEEVEVIAARVKIAELRAEIVRTENAFYERLNQLMGDPEMSVTCATDPPVGSRVQRRVCAPQFVASAKADYAREMIQGLSAAAALATASAYIPPPSPEAAIGNHEIDYRRKVAAVVKDDARLRELAQRRQSLEVLYKAAQKARFKDGRLFSSD